MIDLLLLFLYNEAIFYLMKLINICFCLYFIVNLAL
jgi:hypothetical protein